MGETKILVKEIFVLTIFWGGNFGSKLLGQKKIWIEKIGLKKKN